MKTTVTINNYKKRKNLVIIVQKWECRIEKRREENKKKSGIIIISDIKFLKLTKTPFSRLRSLHLLLLVSVFEGGQKKMSERG